jgi:hypothetical protein
MIASFFLDGLSGFAAFAFIIYGLFCSKSGALLDEASQSNANADADADAQGEGCAIILVVVICL